MINKVALYLRKSRDDNAGETKEETLARHEKMLVDYCQRNGLHIVDIYREVVSGENIANRPEMQKLLEAVDAGLYDGVVCVEVERLSRGNQIDQVEILEVFKHTNTKIYTLQKIYDLNNEDIDEEFFEFSLFMSRREYKIIRRRLVRGRRQATEEGYFTGSVLPFGYTKIKDGRGYVLVPDENEKEIVKYMFEQSAAGVGVFAIASRLNERGIPTKRGGPWSASTVRRILRNPVYIGKLHTDTRGTFDGKHAPIISADLFERVQQARQTPPPKIKKGYKMRNPLSGLVYCAECGHIMRLGTGSKGAFLYKCFTPNCKNRAIAAHRLDAALLDALKTELKDYNYILDNYGDEMQTQKDIQEKEIKEIKKALVKQEKALTVACEMLESGVYSADLFKERSTIIENKIDSLRAQLEQLGKTPPPADERARKAVPILEKVIDNFDTLEPADKNTLLKCIIKRIDYDRPVDDFTLKIETLI